MDVERQRKMGLLIFIVGGLGWVGLGLLGQIWVGQWQVHRRKTHFYGRMSVGRRRRKTRQQRSSNKKKYEMTAVRNNFLGIICSRDVGIGSFVCGSYTPFIFVIYYGN